MKPDLTDLTLNPHGLKQEDLDAYEECYWPLVLKHGRKKFGLACIVNATNGAMNRLAEVMTKHGCLKWASPPMEVLAGSLINLIEEMCSIYKWEREEIKELSAEVLRAKVMAGPKLVAVDGGSLH